MAFWVFPRVLILGAVAALTLLATAGPSVAGTPPAWQSHRLLGPGGDIFVDAYCADARVASLAGLPRVLDAANNAVGGLPTELRDLHADDAVFIDRLQTRIDGDRNQRDALARERARLMARGGPDAAVQHALLDARIGELDAGLRADADRLDEYSRHAELVANADRLIETLRVRVGRCVADRRALLEAQARYAAPPPPLALAPIPQANPVVGVTRFAMVGQLGADATVISNPGVFEFTAMVDFRPDGQIAGSVADSLGGAAGVIDGFWGNGSATGGWTFRAGYTGRWRMTYSVNPLAPPGAGLVALGEFCVWETDGTQARISGVLYAPVSEPQGSAEMGRALCRT